MRARQVYRTSVYILGVSAAVNLFLCWRTWRVLRSPVSYSVNVVQPPVYTNVVLDAVGPFPGVLPDPPTNQAPQAVDVFVPPVPKSWVFGYQYFVDGGRRGVFLNGRPYYVGDVHAYGVISEIFPERIYFASGDYIENERRNNATISSGSASLSP